jgi:hypothetical protein
MPQLGETVSEGTVTRWLHGKGDSVAADEPLLVAPSPWRVTRSAPGVCVR